MKGFMYRVRDATTALFKRMWRGFWRAIWNVYAFDFWDWVYRQAYEEEPFPFKSSDRYNRSEPLTDFHHGNMDEIRWL